MPSEQANRIVESAFHLTGQELTAQQKLHCEELAFNVFTGAICRWMQIFETGVRRGSKKRPKFESIYWPIMNGMLVGAIRRKGTDKFHFDTEKKKQIYSRVHMFLGNGFPATDLDAVVWMCQHATPSEVQSAIDAATFKGVRSATYVRSIIVGNRRRAAANLAALNDKYKKITTDLPNVVPHIPDVKSLQKNWQRKLKDAIERERTGEAEREGSRKIDI